MKNGVLLVNSGTPATLATRDVRAFLAGLLVFALVTGFTESGMITPGVDS